MRAVLVLAASLIFCGSIQAGGWKCSASPWGQKIDIHVPTAEVPFNILGFSCNVQPEQVDLAGTRKIFIRHLTCDVNGADVSIEAFHTDFDENTKEGEFHIQSGSKDSTVRLWWEESNK